SQPWLLEAVGTGRWTGTPLLPLLEEAGPDTGAAEVVFTGLDCGVEGRVTQPYERSLTVGQIREADPLLAWGLNDAPLPPQHGYPVRLLVPGWYGMTSVKWLHRVTVTDRPFEGYQQVRAYRHRHDADDPGRPVTRMLPRALMVPPGIPEFLSRERVVAVGRCRLEGRAWSGHGEIERVEVSADGGRTWWDAQLDAPVGRHAWRGWRSDWEPAEPGGYELCCRATDAASNTQPLDDDWNVGGYEGNAVQRVAVTATAGA
ncbi:MAG: molybdopterin-dependent oxidoreductase, partial [Egibacteraceae bacterium]